MEPKAKIIHLGGSSSVHGRRSSSSSVNIEHFSHRCARCIQKTEFAIQIRADTYHRWALSLDFSYIIRQRASERVCVHVKKIDINCCDSNIDDALAKHDRINKRKSSAPYIGSSSTPRRAKNCFVGCIPSRALLLAFFPSLSLSLFLQKCMHHRGLCHIVSQSGQTTISLASHYIAVVEGETVLCKT